MGKYDDIIHLPHHVSKTHPQMSRAARAAQFSPFAALTGHDDAIKETARITSAKIELDEQAKDELAHKLDALAEHASARPEVTVTYFLPDERKQGVNMSLCPVS